MSNEKTKLSLLRAPFKPNQISKRPKPTKKQTEDLRANINLGIRCKDCGGWHHKDVIHLDYVGHAALTDRLLEVDESWNWEPMSVNPDGSPKFDSNVGLWIKLTVCGVTRIGYGHPDGKNGGDAFKETIGDALRNAAMRFGAALDLWHKGDLHEEENQDQKPQEKVNVKAAIEGQKTESKQQENLGDFVCNIGKKYKGLKLNEMKDFEIASFSKWLVAQAKEQNKTITGPTLEFIEKADLYLKSIQQNDPKFNEREEIPF